MKKEDAIRKINTMGKVGNIVAMIARIFVIVCLVLCVAGLVIVLVLPSNLCRLKVDGRAQVLVDLDAFGWEAEDDLAREVQDSIKDKAGFSYGGSRFAVDKVEMDGSQIRVDSSARLTEIRIQNLAWVIVSTIVILGLLLVGIIFAGRLAKSFRDCESPFEERVIRRMKQFAYSLIPWAVLSSISGSLDQRLWMAGGGLSFDLNVGMIVVVLVILALAYIFQYGAILQRESDETL